MASWALSGKPKAHFAPGRISKWMPGLPACHCMLSSNGHVCCSYDYYFDLGISCNGFVLPLKWQMPNNRCLLQPPREVQYHACNNIVATTDTENLGAAVWRRSLFRPSAPAWPKTQSVELSAAALGSPALIPESSEGMH